MELLETIRSTQEFNGYLQIRYQAFERDHRSKAPMICETTMYRLRNLSYLVLEEGALVGH